MACVAGAVAEFIGRDINPLSDEYIIENGGDIFLRTRRERNVAVYATGLPLQRTDRHQAEATGAGLRRLHVLGHRGAFSSLGRADAVCVIGGSALFSDGLATRLGNLVHDEEDIGRALEEAKAFTDVIGVLVVVWAKLGVWGDVDLARCVRFT